MLGVHGREASCEKLCVLYLYNHHQPSNPTLQPSHRQSKLSYNRGLLRPVTTHPPHTLAPSQWPLICVLSTPRSSGLWAAPLPSFSLASVRPNSQRASSGIADQLQVPHMEPQSLVSVSHLWVSSDLTLSSRVRLTYLHSRHQSNPPRHYPRHYGWYYWYLRSRRVRPDLQRSQANDIPLHWLHSAWRRSFRRFGRFGCWFRHRHCWWCWCAWYCSAAKTLRRNDLDSHFRRSFGYVPPLKSEDNIKLTCQQVCTVSLSPFWWTPAAARTSNVKLLHSSHPIPLAQPIHEKEFICCLREHCYTRQGSTGNIRHDHVCSHLERRTKYFDEFRLGERLSLHDDGRNGARRGLWQHGNVILYYKPAFLYAIWIEVSCLYWKHGAASSSAF